MRRCSSHMSVAVCKHMPTSLVSLRAGGFVLPCTCPGCTWQRGVLALLCVHRECESACV